MAVLALFGSSSSPSLAPDGAAPHWDVVPAKGTTVDPPAPPAKATVTSPPTTVAHVISAVRAAPPAASHPAVARPTAVRPVANPAARVARAGCAAPPAPSGADVTTLASPAMPNMPYAATPGGPAIGRWTALWGGPSTRPVVNQADGWVEISLDTRPNGSAGWVPANDVIFGSSNYLIVVSICQRSLTLYQGSAPIYSSLVGVGEPQSPTPTGMTFVDAIDTTPRAQVGIYGPTVLFLGTHSNTYTDFDGGDGTVGIHGYPSDPASTRGVAESHGCVRASPQTIDAIKIVPVGTPVDIVA